MFKCLNVKMSEGISLYIAIVVMAILLAIVLGLSTILVSQIKMIKGLENSVIAFYAADTGIEEVLNLNKSDPTNPTSSCTEAEPCQLDIDGANYANYYVEVILPGANCGASYYCLKSVGIYKETRRAIEVTY